MANLGLGNNAQAQRVPTPPRGAAIARYDTYLEAQRAVDFLSDHHFQVQFVTIVGSDLQMVERVTGRLTYGRVALAGALSGAWFGLFVGLVLTLFGNGQGGLMLAAVAFGAGFGMLFGLISYASTRGRRDFTSTSQIVAGHYQVLCLEEHAGGALQLLQQLPGGTGRPGLWPPQAAAQQQAPQAPETPGPAPVQAPVSGPTYGEMIDRQRRERQEAEQREQGGGAPP